MVKAVVWDIGGVLLSDPKLYDFWQDNEKSKALRDSFGTGNISLEEFVTQGSSLLSLSKEEFLNKYNSIYYDLHENKEVVGLFLNCSVPCYILSDTNPIHGEFIKKAFSHLFEKAPDSFLSYKTGMRKNSIEVFKFVAQEINVSPEDLLFIDNREKAISFAQEVGYQTHLYTSVKHLQKVLKSM